MNARADTDARADAEARAAAVSLRVVRGDPTPEEIAALTALAALLAARVRPPRHTDRPDHRGRPGAARTARSWHTKGFRTPGAWAS
ncbi:acyl-CoA carboxylase epsilon subunit [Streptomyces sp. O3]